MDIQKILSIVALTVAVFSAVWGAGFLIKKVPQKTLKHINWGVSAVAFSTGLAAYTIGGEGYRYLFLASLVAYFLTIRYKTE